MTLNHQFDHFIYVSSVLSVAILVSSVVFLGTTYLIVLANVGTSVWTIGMSSMKEYK